MSSKSAAKSFSGSNPYGNSSRRGRGWMLIATVFILLIAAALWTTRYTQNIGESIQAPNPQNSSDPVQSAVDPNPNATSTR